MENQGSRQAVVLTSDNLDLITAHPHRHLLPANFLSVSAIRPIFLSSPFITIPTRPIPSSVSVVAHRFIFIRTTRCFFTRFVRAHARLRYLSIQPAGRTRTLQEAPRLLCFDLSSITFSESERPFPSNETLSTLVQARAILT